MSHFTLPTTRPEPSRHVRHPLTPPETDSDYGHLHSQHVVSVPAGLGIELEPVVPHLTHSTAEVSIPPLHRKGPSVAYINSGMRESRDRVIQRSIKWLVTVIPPASFAHEHGHLGSTLSSGPPSRLPQGILMPLYPTMGGQLGAIAREYSLPSIAGLCLYLNTMSAGVAGAPRLTDESWSLLWAQFLDTRNSATSPTHLPICGRIEFDVDLRKARWYDGWLAAPRRDAQDVPVSTTPSRPPTLSHCRDDSRTTFLEDQGDDLDTIPLVQQAKPRTVGRHVPRKLSLVDRFELSSNKNVSKLVPRNRSPPSPTEVTSHRQQSLSPILQQDEPTSARRNLDELITTWRDSASQSASPLAATGQTSLDPANMPNTLPLNELGLGAVSFSPLNLDDFAWSVSSVGPLEYEDDLDLHQDWEDDHSVHLAQRLQGSVCVTPTTCTSFGPPDYDDSSAKFYTSRVPSPDIARRMLDDCPPSPSTCTSWGPPSYPDSPYRYETRAPSIHLAYRGTYSIPATPSTATTWGAMDSYPQSPTGDAYSEVARASDAAERSLEYMQAHENHYEHWTLVWPYYHVQQIELLAPWTHAWPSMSAPNVASQVCPVNSVDSLHRYPYLNIYPASYPIFDLYPAIAAGESIEQVVDRTSIGTGYPTFNFYPLVYPDLDIYPSPPLFVPRLVEVEASLSRDSSLTISCNLPPAYPTFDLYPAVYPWNLNSVYPSTLTVAQDLHVDHPIIRIYSSVYPFNLDEIYSSTTVDQRHHISGEDTGHHGPIEVKLTPHYPVLDIYPSIYPHSLENIYPFTAPASSQNELVGVRLHSHYPTLDFNLALYPSNLSNIYPPVVLEKSSTLRVCESRLPEGYPQLEIYPPIYPWNLQSIHSILEVQAVSVLPRTVVVTRLESHYPLFDLYPAVYPAIFQELYPSAAIKDKDQHDTIYRAELVLLSASYPVIELYAPVYPYNLETIYPVINVSGHKRPRGKRTMSSSNALLFQPRGLRSHNKHASILSISSRHVEYVPPVPPLPQNVHQLRPISPWTGLPLADDPSLKNQASGGAPRYPMICPYPAVYPHFSLYPALVEHNLVTSVSTPCSPMQHEWKYPFLQIFCAVYPYFDLYPAFAAAAQTVVPPSSAVTATSSRIPRKSRKHSHADLHIQVFGKTPPPSPRQLPTPPGGVINVVAMSPRQIPSPRMLSRSRSGTINRSPSYRSSSSSMDGSPVRRQLPTPPGGTVSPMAVSPNSGRILSPRPYGLPGSPASRIPSPSSRPSPLCSPLPPVFELGVAASPSHRMSPQRHIPAQLNLQASLAYRSPGSISASLPTISSSPNEVVAGLTRTMSVPPRPLPRARSGSVAVSYTRAPLPPVPDAPYATVPSYN